MKWWPYYFVIFAHNFKTRDNCQICLPTNDDCAFVPLPLIDRYRGLEQKAYQEIYKPYFGSILMVNKYPPKAT